MPSKAVISDTFSVQVGGKYYYSTYAVMTTKVAKISSRMQFKKKLEIKVQEELRKKVMQYNYTIMKKHSKNSLSQ